MGEARRRRSAGFGGGPVPVDATMTIRRYAPRFGKARVEFRLDGFSTREAYDAVCAIKRTFEQRMGFAEPPAPSAACQEKVAAQPMDDAP